MGPTGEMGTGTPKPADVFDVFETAGFAALSTGAQAVVQASEVLKRAHAFGETATGWPHDEQRITALTEIIGALDDEILPRLNDLCRRAGVADLFERSRMWDRAPALN